MEHLSITKPKAGEYAEYYGHYVSLVDGDDVIAALESQIGATLETLSAISDEKGSYRYAEGKWTIKELIGHVIDTERIMAYRALRIGRDDSTPIDGFEQDPYVENSNYNNVSIKSLADELGLVRKSNVLMFKSFDERAWDNIGTASEYPVSTRGLAYIIAGHEKHHVDILKERYLS